VNSGDDLQRGARRPFGVILVRLRPAEVDDQPVAQVLRDMAGVAFNDGTAGLLVAAHQIAQRFGIQPLRQSSRADEVAEQHGELAAPSVTRRAIALRNREAFGRRRGAAKLGNRLQQQPAMAERHAQLGEVSIGQQRQRAQVDAVLLEQRQVLRESRVP
jgi:hypothetical protein